MGLFIDAQNFDSLTHYDGLLKAVALWLEREDLGDEIPYFIQLAEARFRRLLVNPELEIEIPLPVAGVINLPDDFASVRLLSVSDFSGKQSILQVSPENFQQYKANGNHKPIFAIIAGQLWISPLSTTETQIALTYLASLPSLSLERQSNWLLTAHPDIYLFGSLLQAEFFGWNDSRLPVIKAALDEALDELNTAGLRKRYGAGPLIAPTPVSEAVRGAYRW
ncbi:MAG: hypothetical protein ABF461_04315 [Zymomonas mobilis subsp. pomaceae]|uniref:Constituent protein n=1 Tax=Zymomonas mobilis subsp. pomaceae (strain ATCC 29192 / DSM 22645 / JCM 10191 / CCUG 17912 / NBRC 13757 / NCIMB 11200 / NRRL B-4491 / Barker I) TaxID=579138 RepID=F8ESE2_ZYMMT|nr:hypothetical protein [Zymomonas mobilis]AEI37717.1 hypothetical protein Zymop_0816 [Zymomonas mobilis subsp. pomaceae ATCC 29192]MDX5949084.1 hypothetical protein [Zymomonas mobilis subsp. pomaceae]GEB88889.1 hypothetical protein ZMO02_05260 [Zymomonas mobilis subsp. pomaceae]